MSSSSLHTLVNGLKKRPAALARRSLEVRADPVQRDRLRRQGREGAREGESEEQAHSRETTPTAPNAPTHTQSHVQALPLFMS